MKRFLSVFLSVCMIMSTVSFAAPFMVNTEINAEEAVEAIGVQNNGAKVSAETIKVSFIGDIATEFASINASVGDTLDLSDYLDVEISDSAKAEHKRFNGWMPDGAEKLLTTDTVTVTDADGDGEMLLVALVNHDFNFALEANRNMVSVYRATPAVTDKTIGLTATSTFSQLRIIDDVNGADFEIDTSLYKGVSIYYGYNASVPSDNITSFASGNFNWLYGVGISANAISTTSTKWTSEPEVCPPRALPGWGTTGSTFMDDFDLIKDASGNVLYCGVPVTTETSTTARKASYSCLEETWPGKTLKSMAILLRGRNNESWNVRYLRFVPTVESVKPGINVWTGMNTAYDFENADENSLLTKNWQVTYVTKATTENENNTAARIRSGWGAFSKAIPLIEMDRPVKISFDYTAGSSIRVVMNSTADAATVNSQSLKVVTNYSLDEWRHTSSVHYGNTDHIVDSGEAMYHTKSLDIENLIFFSDSATDTKDVYVDNIMIVPGYKVTYNANGATGSVEADYFVDDEFSDFADGSALSYEGKVFKGWSTSANGETITSVKAIPGSDITLYAVWEDVKNIDTTVSIAAPVAGETAQTTVSGTGFTGTISWSPALTDGKFVNGTAYTATVTLNVAEGYTAGNVAENGYTVANATVTNAAGATTFTATFAATEAAKAKPGLNVWTGTTDAYTFDGAVQSDFAAYGDAVLVEGTDPYMNLAGNYPHFTLKNTYGVVDKDRPVKATFKVLNHASAKDVRIIRNVTNNLNPILGQHIIGVPGSWSTLSSEIIGSSKDVTNLTNSNYTDNTQNLKNLIIIVANDCTSGNVYVDDVSFVPAYKLTYDVNGGNGSVDSVYFFDSYASLDNGASLTNGNMMFKGWSLTKGGEVVTSVTGTPGSDVTVYAVWEDLKNIDTTVSITAPVAEVVAQTTVSGTGFTGTIAWSPALTDGKFAYSTAYTATVTLTVAEGYTASGVAENGYTVANATVTNTAGATTFTATFAATDIEIAKPGLNVWTGTTDAYTFDGAVQSDFAAYGDAVLVEGTDPYMNLAGNYPHFTLKNTYGVVDKDRPVKATFKVLNHASAKDVRIIRNVTNNLNPILGQHIIGVPGSWSTLSSEIIGSSKDVTNLTNSNYTDNTQNLKNLIIIVANDCTSGNVYVDDVSFVPAYKLTYDVNGGNGSVDPVYFFGNTYSTLADGSSLTSDKGEFAGWSLTPDGEAVTSITATPGSDVTLYAVWKDFSDMDAFTYELTSNTPGVANGTMTFVAPTASHTTAEVYFANDDGIMEGYTEFAKVNFTSRIASYTVSGNRSFAMGATKLMVVFSGEGVENEFVDYTIPEAKRLANETPLYKYFVVSDLHLGGDADNIDYFYMQWQSTDPIRTRAFGGGSNNRQADVFNNGADFVIVNGDLVNYGSYDYRDKTNENGELIGEVGEERYWNVLDSFIEERLNNNNIPVFLTNGNHEFQNQDSSEQGLASFIPVRLESVINGQLDYLTENYGDDVVITRDETNPDALYYAVDMQGEKYIFMSTPEMTADKTGSTNTVSAKQLNFVEEQLYDGANSGKTVFVITHLPITDLTNATEVDALLANHPNAVVFNSHTHYNLGFDTHYTVVGDMTTSYTTSDTSATSYLDTGVSNSYETGYNAGQFVEVYEDKIIIKGRKFADNSMFFGHALYIVETPDEGDVKSVAIDGTLAKDSTVTAVVNGSVPADDDSYSYEWIIAGETVSTEKSIKLTNAGVKVILRVTGADGSYASFLSDVVADYAPESYNVSSIRTDYYTGIRFKASVTKQQKEVTVEYGFIVTLKKFLGEKELNHDSGVKYVEGINYGVVDSKEVDKIHEIIGDDIFFTAVVYNIPKTKEAYSEEFVVRPFTKVEGTYYYGDSIERSVLSVAASLRDSNYKDLTAQAIETVKEILTVCGENTEAKE